MAEPHPIPSDPRFQDLSGRVFGKLTVLFYAGRKSGKYSLWHCRCECGREHTVASSCLTLGRTTACPYCARHKPKPHTRSDAEDLAGQKFGRLTVASLDRRTIVVGRGSRSYWLCLCDCGESKVIRGDALKSGKVIGCGCAVGIRSWREKPKPSHRVCCHCKQSKPLTLEFFYNHPQGKWGFNTVCSECVRKERMATNHKYRGRARSKCLIAYGGDPPRCQCVGCTESHVEFLTIDHVDGGGAAHRRSIGHQSIYAWLVANNFPSGFRVLCMNCNFSLGKRGYCPHQR